ncbi:hypothetical protein [Nitrospina watsonii]|uniref:Class I SAM-dependent methyltransferase n=1 Tax=Nitrospina watsonii TaxID=1323948 RepID=A0ABM9HB59_9BACT|nr:hypothetical protein [Nitrospina watsonii]CAI2717421.1 conserved protein of unknown function [Nitrospina watsonii]
MESRIFETGPDRLSLITDSGRVYFGLQRSSAPQLNRCVVDLFEYLNTRLGFCNDDSGRHHQACFNLILRYAYPEIMIDLADLVYVQHERPMVFLNLDHIDGNRRADLDPPLAGLSAADMNHQMEFLFRSLADAIRHDPALAADPVVVRMLAESYSTYLVLTENFPWDQGLADLIPPVDEPVLDVATGLTGFSILHDWPEDYPTLYLSDSMPFIIEALTHYKEQIGKSNVEILDARFPEGLQVSRTFGWMQVSKFLHHLQRDERRAFLKWALKQLKPGGRMMIVDTDLEYRILKEARKPEYRDKLIPGYLETLVDIEDKFCHNLVEDVREAGFVVEDFEYHEFYDETDAYSYYPGDTLPLQFLGFEIVAEKVG